MFDFVGASVSSCVDWLRVRVPADHWSAVVALFDIPGVGSFADTARYRQSLYYAVFPGVIVACNAVPPSDPFVVDFSGGGLALLFQAFDYLTIDSLLSTFVVDLVGSVVTRLDVAIDISGGSLLSSFYSPLALRMALADPGCVCRARGASYIDSFAVADRSEFQGGTTLYIGRRGSTTFLRVYDKRALLLKRGSDPASLPQFWTRFELEYKSPVAGRVASLLLESDFSNAGQLLASFLDFRDSTQGGVNSSRWPRQSWWSDLVGDADRVRVSPPRSARSLSDVRDWLDRSVAPSLALLVEAAGGDLDAVYALLQSGRGRLSPDHKAMLAAYEHGM